MNKQLADQHVVILINYMRRHHVLAFKEVAERVGKLTVLVSTPMEGDRSWEPEWEGLNVIVQSNSTITLRKSSGYDEKNFIHFPWDTVLQLRKLKPDVVLSYEMGVRTLFTSMFRFFNRDVPVIMIGNMSNYIEAKRGVLRRSLRNFIKRNVDYCTYNGPSCKKYLKSLGLDDSRLFYFPYCYDSAKTFDGEKSFSRDGVRKLLFCGVLSERKAIIPFTESLGAYCDSSLDYEVELSIAGDGPLKNKLESFNFKNLKITLLGNCDQDQLRKCYSEADLVVFPTQADEWGLVPVEAWASGVPVLGSKYAQSVEAICKNGYNGWVFDITNRSETEDKIAQALNISASQLAEMGDNSRESVTEFSPATSAALLCTAIRKAISATTDDQTTQTKNKISESPKENFGRAAETSSAVSDSQQPARLATLSIDLDNKWSYLKSHDNPAWEALPSYLNTVVPRILNVLDDLDLKITFFVVGQDAVIPDHHDVLKRIVDHGHEIANHSFHHDPCLHLYSPDQLGCEFEMSEKALQNISGQRMLGFRGPGFSLSDQTLKILAKRGYQYDCTAFPTYLAPAARAFYFMTGQFSRKQKNDRKAMFGKFSDGFGPNSPYLWNVGDSRLLEIPVSTMPGFRTPVHATYLHYLASFSESAASTYWAAALQLYRFNCISPSFLLHPLDFMGADEEPDLAFFPGMKLPTRVKLRRIQRYLEMFNGKFQVLPLRDYAKLAVDGDLKSRPISLVRSGMS